MSLEGATILVTRARSQARSLVALIEARGGRVREFPVIAIAPPDSWEPLDRALSQLERYRWLVVTSPNGAAFLAERLKAGGQAPLPDGRGEARRSIPPLVAVVGSATARSMRDLGLPVDLIPQEFRGSALPAAMAPLLKPGDRVLIPRGDLADQALPSALRALGAEVDEVVAYRTLRELATDEQLLGELARREVQYVTLTSGSTVAGLLERMGGAAPLAGVRLACIGPETKKAAEEAGLRVDVTAARATAEELVEALAADWAAQRRGG